MRSASTLTIALLFTAAAHGAGVVSTDIFSGITCCDGVGVPYSNFVGTLVTNDVQFFTDNAGNWQPFGLTTFGANITGYIAVQTPGTYTLSFTAVDGAILLVGGEVSELEGLHPPETSFVTLDLTSTGVVPFDIEDFSSGTEGGGVDLSLPSGLAFVSGRSTTTPEPSSLLLAGLGLAAVVRFRRRS